MIYLDNAATSYPKPAAVVRAACGVMERMGANPGRSGHRMSLAGGRIVANCRDKLAELLGVDQAEQVIFCFNCTDALNLAIRGAVKPGMHVIATALDHNASLRPLAGLERQGVIRLTVLNPTSAGAVTAAQVQQALCPDTGLVVCAHGSNVTGAVQPVAEVGEVCHRHGALFLVDVAQTIGILPVQPACMQADMVAFPGHKALYGPTGTGALWIRPGLTLAPYREGGTGSRSESVFQPEELPDRYESGTLNLSGIAGLLQGVRFVLAHRAEIAEHERDLARYLIAGLRQIPGVTLYTPGTPQTGVVSFNMRGMRSGEVADLLNRRGIGVRAGLHCAPLAHRYLGTIESGAVRVSPGLYNVRSDLDRLLAVVSRCG
ncbi:MAG: aminotransferase class V-fold PLP-dependent enzyme [Oscillospiraceae bacterium]|jgi:cysteine desulfurase family protein|nr:aminotransferase class V-fold PLP-dependent enzyme [Oscillospiraceae bacterium]